jgi:hypothetical protein
LDKAIYGGHYTAMTVSPRGGCDAVIHSVASYRGSSALHRYEARGIVDRDDRSDVDVANLAKTGVHVLPVAHIENLLLMPAVFLALADALACEDPAARLNDLTTEAMKLAAKEIDAASALYATSQLDRRLKRIGVKAKDRDSLNASYKEELAGIDPAKLYTEFREKLDKSIKDVDLPAVLKVFKNKGVLQLAATALGLQDPKELLERVSRLLSDDEKGKKLRAALEKTLPPISVASTPRKAETSTPANDSGVRATTDTAAKTA